MVTRPYVRGSIPDVDIGRRGSENSQSHPAEHRTFISCRRAGMSMLAIDRDCGARHAHRAARTRNCCTSATVLHSYKRVDVPKDPTCVVAAGTGNDLRHASRTEHAGSRVRREIASGMSASPAHERRCPVRPASQTSTKHHSFRIRNAIILLGNSLARSTTIFKRPLSRENL